MDGMNSFWQLGDELRGQSRVSEDHKWLMVASKLAEQTRPKGERMNNVDFSKGAADMRPRDRFGFQEENKFESLNFNMLSLDSKGPENLSKSSFRNNVYNMNAVYQKNNTNVVENMPINKSSINNNNNEVINNNSNNNNNNNNNSNNNDTASDKRFKTLPAAETLPRNEVLGGYIFVCNNDTMQENLKRQLFDPTAWEDKKCKGESRFPAQVRIRIRKVCKALEEDAFRPVLHHYDGPKFRLELSVSETLELLDLCEQAGM
ncbi:B2 protein [Bienertia sinuspersici]